MLGDPSLGCSKVTVKGLTKELRREKRGLLIECNGICGILENSDNCIPSFLSNTIAKYPETFQPITNYPLTVLKTMS